MTDNDPPHQWSSLRDGVKHRIVGRRETEAGGITVLKPGARYYIGMQCVNRFTGAYSVGTDRWEVDF